MVRSSFRVKADAAVPAGRAEPLAWASRGLRPPPHRRQGWQMLLPVCVHHTLITHAEGFTLRILFSLWRAPPSRYYEGGD